MCYTSTCPEICGPLEPDSDIAGIGVIVAFTTSTILSFVAIISTYIYCVHYTEHKELLNRLDGWIYRNLISISILRRLRKWEDIIIPFSISLNDSQLVGTCAILISGLTQPETKLSVYHFSIVSDLAWMASATALAGFEVAIIWAVLDAEKYERKPIIDSEDQDPSRIASKSQDRLAGQLIHGHFWIRTLRLGLHLLNSGMLGYYSYRQANKCWNESYLCPTQCLSKAWGYTGGLGKRWMAANWALLTWDCVIHIILSYKPLRDPFEQFLWSFQPHSNSEDVLTSDAAIQMHNRDHSQPQETTASRNPRGSTKSTSQLTRGVVSFSAHRAMEGTVILFDSIIFGVVVHIAWYIYNLVCLFQDRGWGQRTLGADNENGWGFGQIFPVLMLALPFFNLVQLVGDAKLKAKGRREE
ncbi:hypothetical protein H0H87_004010 [Tephrocybe sp. NHM501043]|nr:hypothetical protein H0H87_004010 [Tephrocybe sp. NHM501043]